MSSPRYRQAMTEKGIRCPRDSAHASLRREEGGAYTFYIDCCETCGGTWLDRGEFAKVVGSNEAERILEAYASGKSELSCPRDGAQMAQRPVGGVVIDVCPTCQGMWFDARELPIAQEEAEEVIAERGLPADNPRGRAAIEQGESQGRERRAVMVEVMGRVTRTQTGWTPP